MDLEWTSEPSSRERMYDIEFYLVKEIYYDVFSEFLHVSSVYGSRTERLSTLPTVTSSECSVPARGVISE